MFKSLKLYTGATVDLDNILACLVEFGYKRQDACSEEGDFSRRGGILDIFPFTFELPIRIDTSPSLSVNGKRPSSTLGTSVLESFDVAQDGSKDGEPVEPFIEGRSRTISGFAA